MCFVFGIENPIGLHLALYTDDKGRCIARSARGPLELAELQTNLKT
jgi:hypothetical protein